MDDVPGLRRKRGRGCAGIVVLAAVTSAAVSVATVVMLHRVPALSALMDRSSTAAPPVDEAPKAEVPKIAGLPRADAEKAVTAAGFRMAVLKERSHEGIAAGGIVEQDPAAGEKREAGAIVAVVVSTGSANPPSAPDAGVRKGADAGAAEKSQEVPESLVEVPDLLRMHYRGAKREIEKSRLEVGRIRRRYDDNRGPDVVLRQEPEAGARVAPGTRVDLIVNEGV